MVLLVIDDVWLAPVDDLNVRTRLYPPTARVVRPVRVCVCVLCGVSGRFSRHDDAILAGRALTSG